MIETCDSREFMRRQPDYSADIIYADVPYALGSETIIRPDGKPEKPDLNTGNITILHSTLLKKYPNNNNPSSND